MRLLLLTSVSVLLLLTATGRLLWKASTSAEIPTATRSQTTATADDIIRLETLPNPTATQHAHLGLLYLQRVRETGDASYYLLAEQAFNTSLSTNPQEVDALIGQGMLAAGRHEFADALTLGQQAHALNPYKATALGVIVDAYVELGRYPEAIEAVDQMAALKPSVESFSRIAYLRELHGDLDGAVDAMREATNMVAVGSEPWLWTTAELGELYLKKGGMNSAEITFKQALAIQPDYPHAIAGLAHIAQRQGDIAQAIALLEPVVAAQPLPEFTIALGTLYLAVGDEVAADAQFELVRAVQQLNEAAGMNVELEMALFSAEYGDPTAALQQAEAAYAARPSIYAADALAWAHYHNGNLAKADQFMQEALRLGTIDPQLQTHAQQISTALLAATADR